MSKEIRYLSKRRINQLTISQIANVQNDSQNTHTNGTIQESEIDLDLKTAVLENENIYNLDATSVCVQKMRLL